MTNAAGIVIQPMRASDLPVVLALLDRCAPPQDGLAAHVATTLAAYDGDRVVGSAALEVYGDAALLCSPRRGARRRQAVSRVRERLPGECVDPGRDA